MKARPPLSWNQLPTVIVSRDMYFDVSDDGSIIRSQNVIRAYVEDIRDGVPPVLFRQSFILQWLI